MGVIGLNTDEKAQLLAMIRRAKSSHIKWRAYAQGIVAGVNVKEDQVPVRHTDCQFGKWFFGEGQRLLGHLEVFQNIDGPHEMLHSVYEQIFALMQEGKTDAAREKLDQLVEISKTLLEEIELLAAEVDASY